MRTADQPADERPWPRRAAGQLLECLDALRVIADPGQGSLDQQRASGQSIGLEQEPTDICRNLIVPERGLPGLTVHSIRSRRSHETIFIERGAHNPTPPLGEQSVVAERPRNSLPHHIRRSIKRKSSHAEVFDDEPFHRRQMAHFDRHHVNHQELIPPHLTAG